MDPELADGNAVPTPTPTPAPTPIQNPVVDAATKAKVQIIVNAQTATSHEGPIFNANNMLEWQFAPKIYMSSPAKEDIPSSFTYTKPDWCTVINAWAQIYEAEQNTATNTRVQYRNLKIYVLSNTSKVWRELESEEAPFTNTWENPYTFFVSGGYRNEDSGLSFVPSSPRFGRAEGTLASLANPQDVRAVFVTMETKLVLDDPMGADDRAQAKFLLNVGADYWPDLASVGQAWPYSPGVGQGRFITVTNDWKSATLLVPNTRMGSSMQEMIDLYPPPVN